MSRTVFHVVGALQFEWDAEKVAANLAKHKLSFEEGATVFQDFEALILDDPDQFEDEVRLLCLGILTRDD